MVAKPWVLGEGTTQHPVEAGNDGTDRFDCLAHFCTTDGVNGAEVASRVEQDSAGRELEENRAQGEDVRRWGQLGIREGLLGGEVPKLARTGSAHTAVGKEGR